MEMGKLEIAKKTALNKIGVMKWKLFSEISAQLQR